MMRTIPCILLALLMAAVLPSLAGAQQQNTFNPQVFWANQMIGAEVENRQGQRLGEVEDVLVDANGSDISYAVVSNSGFLGIGEDKNIVPLLALEFTNRGERHPRAFLNISERDFRQSPEIHGSNWSRSMTDDMRQLTNQFYTQFDPDYASTVQERFGMRGDMRSQRFNMSNRPSQYERLTDVIGKDVENFNRDRLGKVEDVAIDMYQSRPVYALVGGRFLNGQEGYAPVPWEAVMSNPGDNFVSIDTDRETLAQIAARSPNIDVENRDYAMRVSELFGMEPYWVVYAYTPPEGGMMQQPRSEMYRGPESYGGGQQMYAPPPPQYQPQQYQQPQYAPPPSETYAPGEQSTWQSGRSSDMYRAWRENSSYVNAYRRGQPETIEGRIVSVGAFTPERDAEPGLRVRVETQTGSYMTVHAGPRDYAMSKHFDICPGEQVRISGMRATFDGEPVLIADTIMAHGDTYQLFDRNGTPSWTAESMQSSRDYMRDSDSQSQWSPRCPY